MKAQAPDIIYVPLAISLLTKRQVLRLDATDVNPSSFANENIEYIRKKTILEWAESRKAKASIGLSEYDAGHENGICEVLNELINHIESL